MSYHLLDDLNNLLALIQVIFILLRFLVFGMFYYVKYQINQL